MRLFKYLLFIGIFTTLSLFYVWQKVELVRISYETKRNECEARRLLDRNESLRYNVASLSSPSRLARELGARNLVVVSSKNFEIVRLIQTEQAQNQIYGRSEARGPIFSLLTLRAQAEASQVK